MGATLKRRDGSERATLMFTGSTGFSEFIDAGLHTEASTHFSPVSEVACCNVANDFGAVATGNGHDHIT